MKNLSFLRLLLGVAFLWGQAWGDELPSIFTAEMDSGIGWESLHQFASPSSGSRIDSHALNSHSGAIFRLGLAAQLNEDHALRLLVSPFASQQNFYLPFALTFHGTALRTGDFTEVRMKVDTIRLSYLYTLSKSGPWFVALGASANLRHLDLVLFQGDTEGQYSGTNLLPLFHGLAKWQGPSGWFSDLEWDAFTLSGASLVDLGLRLGKNWNGVGLSAAYRYFNQVTENAQLSHHLAVHGFAFGLSANW